jgi:hypothetical protein
MVGMTVAINSDQFIYKFETRLAARSMRKGAKTPDENAHFNANAPRQLSTIAIQLVKSSMKVTKLIEETLDFGLRNVGPGRHGLNRSIRMTSATTLGR